MSMLASSSRRLATSMSPRAAPVLNKRVSRIHIHRRLQTTSKNKASYQKNASKEARIHSSAKKSQSSTVIAAGMAKDTSNSPSSAQMYTLFVASAIPMCAFGFMDNVIMIQAGGYIDATFGATLGLATLSAAALGQVVSDVSGVVFGSTVEGLLQKYKLMPVSAVPLSQAQRQLPQVRRIAMMGSVAGMVVGCLLGASSLLFVDLHAHERQKRTAELKDVISTMLAQENELGSCRVHLLSSNKSFGSLETSSSSSTSSGPAVQFTMNGDNNSSLVAQCARDQVPTLDESHHILYVPISASTTSETLGVLEFSGESFSEEDQRTAVIVARHVAIFMERLSSGD